MKYFYFATPYTNYFKGREAAFGVACVEAARLVSTGACVFSPVAHWHPLAIAGNMHAACPDFWDALNEPFMEHAVGLLVCTMTGWESSRGVAHEIKFFEKRKKMVAYVAPGMAGACYLFRSG